MSNEVIFSFHASEQLKKRFNMSVPTNKPVDISGSFIKASKYEHPKNGRCEAWVFYDISHKIMLILAQKSKVVLTVYGGEDFDENRDFFTTAYANVATHPKMVKGNAPYKK
jgi:hypothetical protein